MDTPKISVITSAYNAEKTIEETIKSVINQTYKDFEYIIVNHGCTDGTVEIIEKYQNIDNRIRIINMPKNTGYIGIALNKGLDASVGEYICFIDADDRYKIDFLEKMIKNLLKSNLDVIACGYEKCILDANGKYISSIHKFCYEKTLLNSLDYNKYFVYILSQISDSLFDLYWNKVYKKEYLKKHNLRFEEKYLYYNDAYLNVKLYKLKPVTAFINYIGVEYYLNGNTTSYNYQLGKNIEIIKLLSDKISLIKGYNDENNINDKKIYYKKMLFFLIIIMDLKKSKEVFDKYEILEELKYILQSRELEFLLKNTDYFLVNNINLTICENLALTQKETTRENVCEILEKNNIISLGVAEIIGNII